MYPNNISDTSDEEDDQNDAPSKHAEVEKQPWGVRLQRQMRETIGKQGRRRAYCWRKVEDPQGKIKKERGIYEKELSKHAEVQAPSVPQTPWGVRLHPKTRAEKDLEHKQNLNREYHRRTTPNI